MCHNSDDLGSKWRTNNQGFRVESTLQKSATAKGLSMVDFLSRLPTYILPVALGLIEYFLRRFMKIDYPSEFLPASIAAAALGLLSAIVMN